MLRCITTLQCGKTRKILQAGIVTWLTSLTLRISFCIYVIGYWKCSVLEKIYWVLIYVVAGKFHTRVLNPPRWVSIYYHTLTDCFVESQLFTMARHTRCVKLGLKPGWLYASQIYLYIYIYIYIYKDGCCRSKKE